MRDVGLFIHKITTTFSLTKNEIMHNHYHFVYALLLCNADIITKIIANDRLIIRFVLKIVQMVEFNYVYYFALYCLYN